MNTMDNWLASCVHWMDKFASTASQSVSRNLSNKTLPIWKEMALLSMVILKFSEWFVLLLVWFIVHCVNRIFGWFDTRSAFVLLVVSIISCSIKPKFISVPCTKPWWIVACLPDANACANGVFLINPEFVNFFYTANSNDFVLDKWQALMHYTNIHIYRAHCEYIHEHSRLKICVWTKQMEFWLNWVLQFQCRTINGKSEQKYIRSSLVVPRVSYKFEFLCLSRSTRPHLERARSSSCISHM